MGYRDIEEMLLLRFLQSIDHECFQPVKKADTFWPEKNQEYLPITLPDSIMQLRTPRRKFNPNYQL